MTSKFVGQFKFENGTITKDVISEKIPDKRLWHDYSIWEFNGHRYRPITPKAESGLQDLVKSIEASGYTKAIKPGKRKPSSIKYAVQTFGVEDFTLSK